ncbi:methyltransferase domain-containing protein [Caulobacter sp. KR2-114]|uniref:methyltransferase domain-containing protein n=1 Tax=Caulobacter sp. KR2-114 TaxID=3400912 RepID=UPI003C0235A3
MRSFAQRSAEAEWMDADDVSPEVLTGCLADLAKVNTVTLARPPTLAWLAKATRGLAPGSTISVLDVGYGQGDMLRAVHRWATRAGFRPRLTGIDLSPWSAPAAKAATPADMRIDFRTGDVFAFQPDEPLDFVISSLVTHHLPDEMVVRFIDWMEASAQRGWFINDLHRHPLAFYGFTALSTVAGWHPFVRHDGPVSVARAFQRRDWERLLAASAVDRQAVRVDWRFPFRLCVGRVK